MTEGRRDRGRRDSSAMYSSLFVSTLLIKETIMVVPVSSNETNLLPFRLQHNPERPKQYNKSCGTI